MRQTWPRGLARLKRRWRGRWIYLEGSTRLLLLAVLLIALCLVLMGCQTTGFDVTKPMAGSNPIETCHAFAPIYWSKLDTVETQKAVRRHNAVWKELCGG